MASTSALASAPPTSAPTTATAPTRSPAPPVNFHTRFEAVAIGRTVPLMQSAPDTRYTAPAPALAPGAAIRMSDLPSPVRSPGPATLHPKSSPAVSPSIRQKNVSAAAGSGPDRFWPVTTHTCPTVLAFASDNAISSRASVAGRVRRARPQLPDDRHRPPQRLVRRRPRNWLTSTIRVVDTAAGHVVIVGP
jgi:hypothetical protein